MVCLALMVLKGCSSTTCFADKSFKLPIDIKKSTLLFKLRVPWDLLEAANPGCPDQFAAGDTVSLGLCRRPALVICCFYMFIPLFPPPPVNGSVFQQALCHVGGQYLASSGQTIYSVAQELGLKPYDIVKFNEDLNPIYPLQAGSILIVPLPRSKCSSYQIFARQSDTQMDDLQNAFDGLFKLCGCVQSTKVNDVATQPKLR